MRETVTARIYRVTVDHTVQEVTASSPAELAAELQALAPQIRAAQVARTLWQDDHAQVTLASVGVASIGRVVRQVWGDPLPRKRPPRAAGHPPEPLPAPQDDDPLGFFNGLGVK